MTKLCRGWSDKEKVDVALDYITSQGDKNLLTIAAEAQSHSGYDILAFPTWYAAGNADNLEPEGIDRTDRLGIRRTRRVRARIALDPQWASAVGPFGGTTLRISGTMAVATTKQAAKAKKASA